MIRLVHPNLPGRVLECRDSAAKTWRMAGWIDAPPEPIAEDIDEPTSEPLPEPKQEPTRRRRNTQGDNHGGDTA